MHHWSWVLLNLLVWSVGLAALVNLRREYGTQARPWTLLSWAVQSCLLMELAMLFTPWVPGLSLVSAVTGIASAGLVGVGIHTLFADARAGRDRSVGQPERTAGRIVAGTVALSLAAAVAAPGAVARIEPLVRSLDGMFWFVVSGWLTVALLQPMPASLVRTLRPRVLAIAFAIAWLNPALSLGAWLLGAVVPAPVGAMLSSLFVLALVSELYAMVIHIGSLKLAVAHTQLDAYKQQILAVEKLAGVSTLAAGAAHDLRNVLTQVDGFAQLLLEDADLPQAARDDLRRIRDASRSGVATVNGLLGVARMRPGGPAATSVRGTIIETMGLLDPDFRKRRIATTLDLPEGLPVPSLDLRVLADICLNLFLNARDAMADRSEGQLTVTAAVEAGGLAIRVRDTGSGIPAWFREKLFEPLQTTKGDRGTGLGLSVSRSLAREAGGDITYTTTDGHGAEFLVWLPIRTDLVHTRLAS